MTTGILLLVCTIALVSASGSYNYTDPNRDWPHVSASCGAGEEQSPIDFSSTTARSAEYHGLKTDYAPMTASLSHHEFAVYVENTTYGPMFGGSLTVDEEYEAYQFHFHTPSEHTVDGVAHPMEMHIVHTTPEGDLAVLGIFFKVGLENVFLKKFIDQFGAIPSIGNATNIMNVDVRDAFPMDHAFYRYQGSLTTPPCSEDVDWHVFAMATEATQAQIDAFANIIGVSNARPVQPLNSRVVTLHMWVDSNSIALIFAGGVCLVMLCFFLCIFYAGPDGSCRKKKKEVDLEGDAESASAGSKASKSSKAAEGASTAPTTDMGSTGEDSYATESE